MKCNRTKEQRSLFLSVEVASYHFRPGGSNCQHLCTGHTSSHMFFRAFYYNSHSFSWYCKRWVIPPSPPLPCFWHLDFDSSLSTCIAYKLSCLNWACCAQVFYAAENVCRLSLVILYREFTAVMCYFLFSP